MYSTGMYSSLSILHFYTLVFLKQLQIRIINFTIETTLRSPYNHKHFSE